MYIILYIHLSPINPRWAVKYIVVVLCPSCPFRKFCPMLGMCLSQYERALVRTFLKLRTCELNFGKLVPVLGLTYVYLKCHVWVEPSIGNMNVQMYYIHEFFRF
jgi:hypothetical protein